jgi:dTDP-4-amino-4,6-dideoxygalactose transaminase
MTGNKKIPYFDYKFLWESESNDLRPIIEDVCSRGAFILQKDLEDFEINLAKFSNCHYALGVADGTVAISMALRASGLKQNDEVIFCSHTFVATASAIHHAGGIPIPVECGEDRNIDVESVKKAITSKTKAIVPTQLNGRVCNMDALQKIADDHGLFIVEDAAQALGAKFKGKCAGTFGKAGTISFYPAKSLGCYGDGGAILTNDKSMYDQMKLLRDHGRSATGEVVEWGYNSRLDNLQAAILNCKLKAFPKVIERRREIASKYQALLSSVKQIGLPPAPGSSDNNFDTFQNYEIEVENRDGFKEYLAKNGIGTLVQWSGWPVHKFKKLGFTQILPYTEKFFQNCIMLPMNVSLKDEDIEYIAEVIKSFYK